MFPQLLSESQISIKAIGLTIKYLEEVMAAEATIPFASFRPYHGESRDAFLNINTNMVLDFATQEALEIFTLTHNENENQSTTKILEFKSLADLMDRTSTPFGRRLLRKWLSSPLIDADQIRVRQQSVEDLV